jgi:hypothetical protein
MELYIGNKKLTAKADIKLTSAREILLEPGKRAAERTLTVEVIGDEQSNAFFEFYYNVNTTSLSFDPRKRNECILYDNAIPYFEGIAKLNEVTKTKNLITYKLTLHGIVIDFFAEIDGKMMGDLDFSEYTHIYDVDRIGDTFNNTNQVNGSPTAMSEGEGYRYPSMDYGGIKDYGRLPFVQFRPCLYKKEILQKIIAASGYRYESDFIDNNTDFEVDVVIENGSWNKTDTEIDDLKIDVERGTNTGQFNGISPTSIWNTSANYGSGQAIVWNAINQDTSNQYNNSNGQITIANTDHYNFNFFFNCELIYLGTNPLTFSAFIYFYPTIGIIRTRGGVNTLLKSYQMNGNIYQSVNFPVTTNDISDTAITEFNLENVPCEAGDVITIKLLNVFQSTIDRQRLANTFNYFGFALRLIPGSKMLVTPIPEVAYGSTIDPSRILPNDLKQSDFVKWVSNQYNLVFDYDKQDPKKLIIEPYDDYQTQNLVDLRPFVDISSEFSYKPLPDDLSGAYKLTYSEADDILNTRYKTQFNEVHGTKILDTENEFNRGEKKIESGFSPLIFYKSWKADRYFGMVNSGNNGSRQQKGKLRTAYIKTNITCNPFRVFNRTDNLYDNSGSILSSRYNYVGFMNDPVNPTADQSFGLPKAFYHMIGAIQYNVTNANLFNLYWFKRLERYRNKNTRLLEATIKMDTALFNISDFRKLYYLDNSYFRLLEIQNFSPKRGGLTRCLFISEIDSAPPTITSTPVNGGGGLTPDGENYPIYDNVGKGDILWNGINAGLVHEGQEPTNTPDGLVLGGNNEGTYAGTSINSPGSNVSEGGVAINSSGIIAGANEVYINGNLQESSLIFGSNNLSLIGDLIIDCPEGAAIEITKATLVSVANDGGDTAQLWLMNGPGGLGFAQVKFTALNTIGVGNIEVKLPENPNKIVKDEPIYLNIAFGSYTDAEVKLKIEYRVHYI